jgi:phage gpG-like protein
MHASIMDNVASQGRPQSWEKLKPETVERKGHDRILFETGRLMGSISCRASADSLRITADVPYAQPLQFGTGSTGLPARPFLIFQDGDINTIVSLIESYITSG